MKNWLQRWLPSRESLHGNRWLGWLGPALHHPRLWHLSRKGVAMGLALGLFFGLLIPVAQIPFSAALAVLLRANLPVAVASTLVTNPVTFGPVYYGAYQLGKVVLQEPLPTEQEAEALLSQVHEDPPEIEGVANRLRHWWAQIGTVGKPLVVGLSIVASTTGVAVYFLFNALWILKTRMTRRKRLQQRRSRPSGRP